MSSKNTFNVINNIIRISREGWNKTATTTYCDDYFNEIKKYTWGIKNGYLHNNKLGYLHRYIIGKWYGQDMLDETTKANFVIDHMDNDNFNNQIENLFFLAENENLVKGLTLDKQMKYMCPYIALNIYCDFTTHLFQIAIFFNTCVSLIKDENKTYISAIRLLYDTNYKIVIADAKSILDNFELSGKIDFDKLNQIDIRVEPANIIYLTPEEMANEAVTVQRGGKYYLIMRDTVIINKISYIKGWKHQDKSVQEFDKDVNLNP